MLVMVTIDWIDIGLKLYWIWVFSLCRTWWLSRNGLQKVLVMI